MATENGHTAVAIEKSKKGGKSAPRADTTPAAPKGPDASPASGSATKNHGPRPDNCHQFDFFQAVRLLQRAHARKDAAGRSANPDDESPPVVAPPDKADVGRDSEPARETLRFKAQPSLAFPPSAITALSPTEAGGHDMTVAFMGLTGPLGVMPQHYTEMVIQRNREKDTALGDFLDLFNHRFISLFYRAWEKHRIDLAFEKGTGDHFASYLLALLGLGTGNLQNRLGVEDRTLLYYAGLLSQRPRSAGVLKSVLESIFDVPVRIAQFVGQWFQLDGHTRSKLGERNNRLGVDTVIGERIWDRQAKFALRIGPLNFATFKKYLCSGGEYLALTNLVRLFAGEQFDFALQLTIKKSEAPLCTLTSETERAPKLGWTSWLISSKTASSSAADFHLDDITLDVT